MQPSKLEKSTHSYIDFVMSLTPGGMKSGKEAILKLLSHIETSQNTLNVFHVTGSNGKGSVCQMISQVLYKQFGKKVGLFTSPHLIDITERFQINGKPISYTVLNKYYKRVFGLSKKYNISLSFFEIQVVSMILYFSDQKVDYAVVEVGLGGLYDGTNIFEHPLACFITSVTLEHTHLLGKTRMSVLKNKLGIVKPGTRLYTHLNNAQIRRYCEKIGAQLRTGNAELETQALTNLPGRHQQKNALLVLSALKDLGYDTEKIYNGLRNIYNPGRYEWITPNILVDTANNRESIILLSKMIQKDGLSDTTLIFGTTQIDNKYVQSLIDIFSDKKMIFVDGFCDRALPYSEYVKKANQDTQILHLDTLTGKKTIQSILQEKDTHKKYIIFGSLYLVGYVMRLSRYNIFANK